VRGGIIVRTPDKLHIAAAKYRNRYRLMSFGLIFLFLLSFLPVTHAAVKSTYQPQKSTKGDMIANTASKYKGVPYIFGGASPKGFDCSGFIMYVFDQHNIKLPRTADKQFEKGKFVAQKDLKVGDLVFFTTYEKGASHCGIYMGKNNFIHASSSRGVMISALSEKYWKDRYVGARRVLL
jgi:cell wall-associated NlpC family hydrolase